MPAARGVKRSASKASAPATSSAALKNKKKRGPIQLEIPTIPTKRGRLLTCGMGDVGQLGLGEDVQEVTRFKFVSALGDKIVSAVAGGMHTVALDSDGKVWTFGCNDEGALGRATSDEATPGKVTLPRPAAAISAGDSHTAALLDNGDVYAWGAFRDSHGSMGLVVRGREGRPCREPVPVEVGEPAVAVASGGDHLVILGVSGSIYTMGCGEQGQLGRLSQRSAGRDARQGFSALLTPSKVTLRSGASRVWAGYHATFALDSAGEKMFAWGLNNYGQLGITGEKRRGALYSPTECSAFNTAPGTWARVACGQHHSVALSDGGRAYAVGRCEYGRLGLGDRPGDAEVLEPIPKLQDKRCVSIAAGTSNSFAVTDTGEVFAWGMGSEGQLGTGSADDAAEPTLATGAALKDCAALLVSAGGQHTVLLAQNTSKAAAPSPVPEPEAADQKAEDEAEADAEAEAEAPKAKRPRKKKEAEDDQVSSTSTAADVAHDDKPQAKTKKQRRDSPTSSKQSDDEKRPSRKTPQSRTKNTRRFKPDAKKVNGKDKKEIAMEVDETDNAQEEAPKADAPDDSIKPAEADTKTEPEPLPVPETNTEEQSKEQPAKSDDTNTETPANDVDMKEVVEPVNGTPESEMDTVEKKSDMDTVEKKSDMDTVEKKSEAIATESVPVTA